MLALAAMKQAALDLGGYVRDQILANGGKYVVVVLINDISETPFGQSLPAVAQPVLTSLSLNFNQWLRESLTGQPVQLFDTYTWWHGVYANPTQYGIANNTVPACDPAKISVITGGAVTNGSSMFCNSTPGAPYNGLLAGADAMTWFFADTVHPTTGGYKVFSDAFIAQLKSFGWI
jgi:outer membrane lipase/esterase